MLNYFIYKHLNLKKCPTCGKIIPFGKRKYSLLKYCSKQCCNLDKSLVTKRVNTILSKSKTERELSNQKRNNTNIQRHGGIGFQIQKLKENAVKNCLVKYGCKNVMQNEDIKRKAHDTSIKKYGCKIKQMADFYDKMVNNWKEYIVPLFSKSEYKGKNNIYKWKCALCGNEFEQRIFTSRHLQDVLHDQCVPRCLKCFPSMIGKSQPENDLFQFCKQYFPNLIEHENKNVRTFLKNREIDILIPEIKLAIEFNGVRFHSIQGFKRRKIDIPYHNYHLNKTLECEKLGYRLIHIWEHQWNENKELIKQKLIKIFLDQEDLCFNDQIIKLDRMWYSKNQIIENYKLIEETSPKIFKVGKYDLENCGYLIYKRIN